MAVGHAAELATIVASYLRKRGLAKTLSVFLDENGGMTGGDLKDVDLETLYMLYISTQANGASKLKKSKSVKQEDGSKKKENNEDLRHDGEEKTKAKAEIYANEGTLEHKRERKKKRLVTDSSPVLEVVQAGDEKEEARMTSNEKQESKKKRSKEKLDGNKATIEDLQLESKKDLSKTNGMQGPVTDKQEKPISNEHALTDCALQKNVGANHDPAEAGMATRAEVTGSEKASSKKRKKEKKKQGGEELSANDTLESEETRPVNTPDALLQEDGLSKKKRKKLKDMGGLLNAGEKDSRDETVLESTSKAQIKVQLESSDAMVQLVESTSAKKKKHRKELSLKDIDDAKGNIQEFSNTEVKGIKKDKVTVSEGTEDHGLGGKELSGKKRKSKEDTTLEKSISNGNYGDSKSALKEVKVPEEGEGIVVGGAVETHESGPAKTKKQKDTPGKAKTPTGALAFKRVDAEKVSFSDARLSDNSYWAKDGAEEGYGAKAQEVLGLVRGRDFRHEKTKKKRGSYRGGLIGLQSHSIKFENSDED